MTFDVRNTSHALARAANLLDLRLFRPAISEHGVEASLADFLTAELSMDPATARMLAKREGRGYSSSSSDRLRAARRLAEEYFEPHQGLLRVRDGVDACALFRLVDPDVLAALHPELAASPGFAYDWSVFAAHALRPALLNRSSCDTHLHLGGALPPAFFWVRLMINELDLSSIASLEDRGSGRASRVEWMFAVARAARARYRVALCLAVAGAERWPALPPPEDPRWDPFRADYPLQNEPPLIVRHQVARLIAPRDELQTRSRSDPLAASPSGTKNEHLFGERRLLFSAAHHFSLPHSDDADRHAFLDYLRVRCSFYRCLVYDAAEYGLDRFSELFGRRRHLWSGRTRSSRKSRRERRERRVQHTLARLVCRETATMLLAEPYNELGGSAAGLHERGLELRISVAPRMHVAKILQGWLLGFSDYLEESRSALRGVAPPHRIGFVVHFMKRRGNPDGEAKIVTSLLRYYPWLRPFIVGIDAAGAERWTSVRDMASAFASVIDCASRTRTDGEPQIRLGCTFHVGEDPADLLTGLRHIDEVIRLLFSPKMNGRLGHALSLADSPADYYARRRGFVELPFGTHLLDLIWAWGRTRQLGAATTHHFVQNAILESARRMQISASFDLGKIELGWRYLDVDRLNTAPALSEAAILGKLEIPEEQAAALIRIRPSKKKHGAWLSLLDELQNWLRDAVRQRSITVECNPTSNLLVGNYLGYDALPYKRLTKAHVKVSINTDDPGLLATSLPAELERMHAASWPEDWLIERLADGVSSSFLTPRTPSGDQAILEIPRAFYVPPR